MRAKLKPAPSRFSQTDLCNRISSHPVPFNLPNEWFAMLEAPWSVIPLRLLARVSCCAAEKKEENNSGAPPRRGIPGTQTTMSSCFSHVVENVSFCSGFPQWSSHVKDLLIDILLEICREFQALGTEWDPKEWLSQHVLDGP